MIITTWKYVYSYILCVYFGRFCYITKTICPSFYNVRIFMVMSCSWQMFLPLTPPKNLRSDMENILFICFYLSDCTIRKYFWRVAKDFRCQLKLHNNRGLSLGVNSNSIYSTWGQFATNIPIKYSFLCIDGFHEQQHISVHL